MAKGLPRSLPALYGRVDDLEAAAGLSEAVNVPGTVPSAVAATVVAAEFGTDAARKTIFTLTDMPIEVISVTTGSGVGGTQIYDFPEGYFQVVGCLAELSMSVAVAKQADFTDGAVAGDLGIGTLAPANADALGTDATDDNLSTSTAFLMSAFAAASVVLPPEATLLHDGHTTAVNLLVNALVDAAEIDDGTTSEILVSGRIEVNWIHIGDN